VPTAQAWIEINVQRLTAASIFRKLQLTETLFENKPISA
jgi:hypothetical protein